MLEDIIQRMHDPSDETRSAAASELYKLARSGTLTIEDARALIVAAATRFGDPQQPGEDCVPMLIASAREIAKDKDPSKLLPTIESSLANLLPSAKGAMLRILTMIHSPAAARLYVRCLREYGSELGRSVILTFSPDAGPGVASVLFPALLEVARDARLAHPILHMLLSFREADVLPASIAREFHGSLAAVLRAEIKEARPFQRATGRGWKDELPYATHREMIGLLFDLAGLIDSTRLMSIVREAGDLLDPRLRRFRAVALLRKGEYVPDTELEWIAESPRDRHWLFDQLKRMSMGHRLPPACLDQELLAEGELVDWLCFPTELGREPDEIVLIHKETRPDSNGARLLKWFRKSGAVDYFFFKFRVTEEHWSKEDGWMVGMAGGYPRDEQPTCHAGATFSFFKKLDEKSLRDHIADFLD